MLQFILVFITAVGCSYFSSCFSLLILLSSYLSEGEVFDTEDWIAVENLPIITPNGDVVANNLTFKVCSTYLIIFPLLIEVIICLCNFIHFFPF